jgi:GntR family transcriptional regulator, transcriptional repressor for pyruvate dehydrogenase complex
MSSTFAEGPYRRDRASVADRVLADLRTRILSGQLARGTRLPSEKELAAYYDVSAPTIREVIRALSAMSLVEARHGSGTFVTAQSDALLSAAMTAVVELESIDLASIIELSDMLYVKAASLAVRAAQPAELDDLMAVAERFRPSMTDSEYVAAQQQFLHGLVAASHNKLLIIMADFMIETRLRLSLEATRRERAEGTAGQLREQRIEIASALRARDDNAAQSAVRRYMRRVSELISKYESARRAR